MSNYTSHSFLFFYVFLFSFSFLLLPLFWPAKIGRCIKITGGKERDTLLYMGHYYIMCLVISGISFIYYITTKVLFNL